MEGTKTLKELRKERRLTLQQAAKGIGVHYSALSRMEKGDYPISKKIEKRICDFYEVDLFKRGITYKEECEHLKSLIKMQENIIKLQNVRIKEYEERLGKIRNLTHL